MTISTGRTHGWAAIKPGHIVVPWSYTPRPLGPSDIEVKIDYTGICGSDLHKLKNDMGDTQYPIVCGHEIAGRVASKGKDVIHLDIGDVVGVGPIVYSCLKDDCRYCSQDLDTHCPDVIYTYGGVYPDGSRSQGGYAESVRVHASMVFKIPSEIDPAHAPPLLCAGVSVYAPMVKYGVKKGDRVGVLGIGGLGHLAIQFASALGAEVVAVSRTSAKRKDAIDLGATHFVNAADEGDTRAIYGTLKYLFVTADCASSQLNELVHWMDIGGHIVVLTLSKEAFKIESFILAVKQVSISGNFVGGKKMTEQALQFAAKHGIRPVIERFPMTKINEALEHANAGHAHYRVILEN